MMNLFVHVTTMLPPMKLLGEVLEYKSIQFLFPGPEQV